MNPCYPQREAGSGAAWLAHLLREQEVGGSNPLFLTNFSACYIIRVSFMRNLAKKKILLCILDGFGVSSKTEGNAVLHAPLLTKLINSKNTVLLEASGKYVGLPNGQCGNSEV